MGRAASARPDAEERVAPGVWRIEVPSRTLPPFTTTNAYVVGHDGVALVIDPGGDDSDALHTIRERVEATGARSPKGIVLTHTHADHTAGVAALRAWWPDAALYVHPLELPRTDAAWRATGLADGRRLTLGGDLVEAVHTPGHSPGHLALWLERQRVLIAGDLVAGAGSMWVGHPEGDITLYLESLARAAALAPRRIAPGHGNVRDGTAVLDEARAHRLEREAHIVRALTAGPMDLPSLCTAVYGESLPAAAVDFAQRSLLAHLLKLMRERRVMHVGVDELGPYMLPPGGASP